MNDVNIDATALFCRLLKAYASGKYRYFVLQGGTWSGKTYSIMQLLYFILSRSRYRQTAMVISETYTHIKDGPLTDLMKIIGLDKDDKRYNITDKELTVGLSKMMFRTADKPSKLKTAKKDIVYLNEANSLDYSIFKQANYRARSVFIDFNPDTKFWAHDLIDRDDCWFDISTYKDNHYTPQDIIDNIESEKESDPEWYRVYGLGQIGKYDGLVFTNWECQDLTTVWENSQYDELFFGLDFGYNPDPNAFLVVALKGDTIYVFKEIVVNDIVNSEMAKLILPWCGHSPVFCDSASPLNIRELQEAGVNALKCGPTPKKDRDFSINWLRVKKIIIDKRCTSVKNELEKFARKKDTNGNFLPVFDDRTPDHCISALRYAFSYMMSINKLKSINLGD